MNEFSEIEQELKRLRPLPPSPELLSRIERGVNAQAPAVARSEEKAPTPLRLDWLWLGPTLAAAAVVLLFVRFQIPNARNQETTVARAHAAAPAARSTMAATTPEFIPDSSTRVVYHSQDEGLLFANGSDEPVRRRRTFVRETQQWRNPATGASLRVSYPSEQIELIPVAFQ